MITTGVLLFDLPRSIESSRSMRPASFPCGRHSLYAALAIKSRSRLYVKRLPPGVRADEKQQLTNVRLTTSQFTRELRRMPLLGKRLSFRKRRRAAGCAFKLVGVVR